PNQILLPSPTVTRSTTIALLALNQPPGILYIKGSTLDGLRGSFIEPPDHFSLIAALLRPLIARAKIHEPVDDADHEASADHVTYRHRQQVARKAEPTH